MYKPNTRRRNHSQILTTIIALAMVTMPMAPAMGLTISDHFGETWEQTAKITPDDSDETAWYGTSHTAVKFGSSLAADGDTLAVSTTYYDSHEIDWVYVFERNDNGQWHQQAKLEGNDQRSAFGMSIDVDEEEGILVAGDQTYQHPEQNGYDGREGVAYVYERSDDGEWNQAQRLVGPDEWEWDGFGKAVAVDGQTIVVSPTRENTGAGENTGAVYVYEQHAGDEWVMTDRIVPGSPMESGSVGGTDGLTLEDGRLIVTVPTERLEPGGLVEIGPLDGWGAVYVFEEGIEGWTQVERLTAPQGEQGGCFGHAAGLSGDRLVVADPCRKSTIDQAAPWNVHLLSAEGYAYVFERQGTDWEFEAALRGSDATPGSFFSWSVDILHDRIVVGADLWPKGGNAGAAYVFDHGEGWEETAKLRSDETVHNDKFGHSVAIGGHGNVLVGSPEDDNRQDGWPYPFDNTNLPLVQEEDGWKAGSVFEFAVNGESLTVEGMVDAPSGPE